MYIYIYILTYILIFNPWTEQHILNMLKFLLKTSPEGADSVVTELNYILLSFVNNLHC